MPSAQPQACFFLGGPFGAPPLPGRAISADARWVRTGFRAAGFSARGCVATPPEGRGSGRRVLLFHMPHVRFLRWSMSPEERRKGRWWSRNGRGAGPSAFAFLPTYRKEAAFLPLCCTSSVRRVQKRGGGGREAYCWGLVFSPDWFIWSPDGRKTLTRPREERRRSGFFSSPPLAFFAASHCTEEEKKEREKGGQSGAHKVLQSKAKEDLSHADRADGKT